jgi:hypothetical protein
MGASLDAREASKALTRPGARELLEAELAVLVGVGGAEREQSDPIFSKRDRPFSIAI